MCIRDRYGERHAALEVEELVGGGLSFGLDANDLDLVALVDAGGEKGRIEVEDRGLVTSAGSDLRTVAVDDRQAVQLGGSGITVKRFDPGDRGVDDRDALSAIRILVLRDLVRVRPQQHHAKDSRGSDDSDDEAQHDAKPPAGWDGMGQGVRMGMCHHDSVPEARDEETELAGGAVGGAVRVGRTVRRPTGCLLYTSPSPR